MVMQCGVKRKHSSLADTNIDVECHQQSLLELSVHKLQEEQVKYGIEPRLLRFVLINNTLKVLQSHMLRFDIDSEFGLFDNQSSHDLFLINTCNHGCLSSPVSPPTPVKAPRLDASPFSSHHSPLLNSCTLGCPEIDPDDLDVSLLPLSPFPYEDRSTLSAEKLLTPTGKRKLDSQANGEVEEAPPTKAARQDDKKVGRPSSLCILEDGSPSSNHSLSTPFSSLINLSSSSSSTNSSPSSSSDDSTPSSLSPIDFSNVDVSLYDYDAKASLSLPQVDGDVPPPTRNTSSSLSISSCVKTYIKPVEYNEVSGTSGSSNETDSDLRTDTSVSDACDSMPLLPESSEIDNLDEIDRIVSLLMT